MDTSCWFQWWSSIPHVALTKHWLSVFPTAHTNSLVKNKFKKIKTFSLKVFHLLKFENLQRILRNWTEYPPSPTSFLQFWPAGRFFEAHKQGMKAKACPVVLFQAPNLQGYTASALGGSVFNVMVNKN